MFLNFALWWENISIGARLIMQERLNSIPQRGSVREERGKEESLMWVFFWYTSGSKNKVWLLWSFQQTIWINWEDSFWRWGRFFGAMVTQQGQITTVCHFRDIFEHKVEEKVTSEMQPQLPNCSEELCKVIDALTDCRLPNRSLTLLLPKAFQAIPVILLHLSSHCFSEPIYRQRVSYFS